MSVPGSTVTPRHTAATSDPGAAGWTASELQRDAQWILDAAEVPELAGDVAALRRWAATQRDPVAALARDTLDLPVLRSLASHARALIERGPAVAWIRGVAEPGDELLGLIFLYLGLQLGDTIDTYGRLYAVEDRGGSYQTSAIPVSQTRESTGLHTDSSNAMVWPRVIGLACLQPSTEGGGSRVVSVPRVASILRARHPDHFRTLTEDFLRDVVTPGSDRHADAVRSNSFPILYPGDPVEMRYMRFWIERGHDRAGIPLCAAQVNALDALDALLDDPALNLRFRLEAGDLLLLHNRRVAHDRDAYNDDPAQPRRLLRLWLT